MITLNLLNQYILYLRFPFLKFGHKQLQLFKVFRKCTWCHCVSFCVCLKSFSFVEPSHIFIHCTSWYSATRLLELCQVFWPVTEMKNGRGGSVRGTQGPGKKLGDRRREGGKAGEMGERRGATRTAECRGGGRGFLCDCRPILSPENVTLPLGGSAPRRDSSVRPHLQRCSVAGSRGAREASRCTLSAHQHLAHCSPAKPTADWIFCYRSVFHFFS